MLPAHEEILSIQLVTNNKYARQVRSCAAGFRIKRNCSDNSDLSKRCEEYKRYLVRQEYPKSLVDKEFNKALKVNRKDLFHAKVKPKKKVYPFVT